MPATNNTPTNADLISSPHTCKEVRPGAAPEKRALLACLDNSKKSITAAGPCQELKQAAKSPRKRGAGKRPRCPVGNKS